MIIERFPNPNPNPNYSPIPSPTKREKYVKIRVKSAVDFVRVSSKITGLLSEYARLLYPRFDSDPALEITQLWSSIIFSVKQVAIVN